MIKFKDYTCVVTDFFHLTPRAIPNLLSGAARSYVLRDKKALD